MQWKRLENTTNPLFLDKRLVNSILVKINTPAPPACLSRSLRHHCICKLQASTADVLGEAFNAVRTLRFFTSMWYRHHWENIDGESRYCTLVCIVATQIPTLAAQRNRKEFPSSRIRLPSMLLSCLFLSSVACHYFFNKYGDCMRTLHELKLILKEVERKLSKLTATEEITIIISSYSDLGELFHHLWNIVSQNSLSFFFKILEIFLYGT